MKENIARHVQWMNSLLIPRDPLRACKANPCRSISRCVKYSPASQCCHGDLYSDISVLSDPNLVPSAFPSHFFYGKGLRTKLV